MIQNSVDLVSGKVFSGKVLSGKVYAFSTRAMGKGCQCGCRGDHSRSASTLRHRLPRHAGGGPLPQVHERCVAGLRRGHGLVPHRCTTRTPAPRSSGPTASSAIPSITLRAFANGQKDDWGLELPLSEFAINNVDSVLGDGLTPSFIDRSANPSLTFPGRSL
jgi:hypothetical protein